MAVDRLALLRDAFDLLETHLGDTDLDCFESEEEEREAVPVQVAARLVMQAIQDMTDGIKVGCANCGKELTGTNGHDCKPFGIPPCSAHSAPLSGDMRAEFDAWVKDRGCDTDGAWSAWQACWKLTHGMPVLHGEPIPPSAAAQSTKGGGDGR